MLGLGKLWDHSIRRVPTQNKEVFLSFDDGPSPEITPFILDHLKMSNSKASFFLITEKAQQHQAIVERIKTEGHAIGNHSKDHNYTHYFKSLG